MAGVSINISLRGVKEVRNLLGRYARATGGGRGELHQRYGIQALNWINRNFQTEGGLLSGKPWAKLSPNTIAGRRKGSSRILQDTGAAGLRGSFTMQFSDQQVAIGSALLRALFHNEGTGLYGKRGAKYPIVPKKAGGVLAFQMAEGGSRVRASFSSVRTRRTFKKSQMITFARKVMHPGVQVRRMLPTQQELMPQLLRATINFLKELKGKGEQL